MLVIDTSGSMNASGMATVRTAVKDFLAKVPPDVKVGVVSFADTSGIDVEPTTDRAKVQSAVNALRSDGETALYAAVQDAVQGLGTTGERSIVLLSDGGDTVAEQAGGAAGERKARAAAVSALTKAKVRAEVVAFKSPEANSSVLQQFAKAGGGSVVAAADRAAVAEAFDAAALDLGVAGPHQRCAPRRSDRCAAARGSWGRGAGHVRRAVGRRPRVSSTHRRADSLVVCGGCATFRWR